MRDLYHNLAVVHLLDAQDLVHTDTPSGILDLQGFDGALLVVTMGVLTGVDGSNSVLPVLQESATCVGTDFTTVAAADLIGAFTAVNSTAKDSTSQAVGYIGSKRYVRVNLDYTGTGISAGIVGILGILGIPRHAPVTAPSVPATT